MWNGLDALAPVQRGMVLRLYVEPDFDSAGVVMIDPARVTVVKPGSNAAENALAHAAAGRAATVKRIRHKIRRGESLWSISKKYGVTVASIKAENGFGRGRGLKPGRTIVVPRDVAPKPKGKAARRKAKPGIRGKRYRVKPGDSLWKISRRFGVPLLKLKKKNKMGKRSRLKPGQTLFIPR
jgi:membrane-bound lytic murein transglycosylase D